MDAFERAKRRYYNHTPMPQAAAYVKLLEARLEVFDELSRQIVAQYPQYEGRVLDSLVLELLRERERRKKSAR